MFNDLFLFIVSNIYIFVIVGTVDVLDNGPVYGIDDLYDDVEDDKDALFDILELSKKPKIKKEKVS